MCRRTELSVAMLDLMCQVPFYDRYLARALLARVEDFALYVPPFRFEPDYLSDVTRNQRIHLSDWANRWPQWPDALRKSGRVVEYLANWLRLLRLFKRRCPAVVHVQWLPLMSSIPVEVGLLRCARRLGARVVFTMHNYTPHDSGARQPRKREQLLSAIDALIVHTQSDRQRIVAEDGWPTGIVHWIPQGPVFYEQYSESPAPDRDEWGLAEDDIVFLSFGLVRPYKGLDDFLRAFAVVARRNPTVKLLVVGRALDRQYAAALRTLVAAEGIARQVLWVDRYVPSAEVGSYHQLADVAIFPYWQISQSAAFLTAAAQAKLTLSARVGGIAEIVDACRAGVQLESHETEAIVQAIQACVQMSAEERLHHGQVLRTYVMTHLSWERIAAETVKLYTSLI